MADVTDKEMWPADELRKILGFESYNTFKNWLDRHPGIRTEKPSQARLNVNALECLMALREDRADQRQYGLSLSDYQCVRRVKRTIARAIATAENPLNVHMEIRIWLDATFKV